jgi:hypothetical protein
MLHKLFLTTHLNNNLDNDVITFIKQLIIIPQLCCILRTKNDADNITKTLDTILPYVNQIIICDHASTDDTINVCHYYF